METLERSTAIAELLAGKGITYTATHIPSVYNPGEKDKSKMQGIKWMVIFSRGNDSLSSDYTQGIGHLPAIFKDVKIMGSPNSMHAVGIINETLQSGRLPAIEGGQISRWRNGKPLTPPTALDVLYCLVSDRTAEDSRDFAEWATELGYDSDSIKARDIYEACLKIARDLRRIFGDDGIKELQRLTEDY